MLTTSEDRTERLSALAEVLEAIPDVNNAGLVKQGKAQSVCEKRVTQILDILEADSV